MHYSLTRATLWNLAGYLYLFIAALVATPILIHSLGLSQFATYSVVVAATILVSSIDFGLPQAVARALAISPKPSPSRQTLWATSSLLFILSGLLSGLIALLITSLLHIGWLISILVFLICLLNNLLAHYSTLPQAEGHFGYYNAKTFIVGTGNTLVSAYVATRGWGLLGIFTALLFCYLLTLMPLVYFSLKFFPRPREGRPSLSVAKSLLAFGFQNQFGKLVGQAQSQYGKYLLIGLSPLSLSAYVIGVGLVQKMVGGVAQLASAFYPAAARSGQSQSLRLIYYRTQLGLFALGLLAIGAYSLFGYSFLIWWLHDTTLVSLIHTFLLSYRYYALLLLLTPLASTILDSFGYPLITSIFAFIAFVIELSSAIWLYPRYGLLAPAYAGIISLLLMTPILLLFTGRILSPGGKPARPLPV